MAQIVRLTTKQQRSGQEEAAQAAEQLSLLSEELLKHLPGEARIAISRATHAMLSRMQTATIWDAIRALPSDDRPNQVRHAFDLVLLNLRQDTGEVLLTRDQLAEEINCAPRSVSTIMGTLEKMGVIRRERRTHAARTPPWWSAVSLRRNSRSLGTNPRSLGTNPKALGLNPKALGLNPRALGLSPRQLGISPRQLGISPKQLTEKRYK